MMPSASCILGVPVHDLTMESALNVIQDLVRQGQHDGCARYVATVNVDFLVNALGWRPGSVNDPALLEALRTADLVTADGMPLVWYSRMMGHPLPERVTGVDLVEGIASRASQSGERVYLLGGGDGVALQAAEQLIARHPGLQIAGCSAPMIVMDDASRDEEILQEIHATQPDILLLALGNPKQELWFKRIQERLQVPVSIGVGGTLDFITGRTKRAPGWMQRCGLEWVWRLSQEPARLAKRYGIGLLKFGWIALPPILSHWFSPSIEENRKEDLIPEDGMLDFTSIRQIDLPLAGSLTRWASLQKAQGASIQVTGLSPAQERWLNLHRISDLIKEHKT